MTRDLRHLTITSTQVFKRVNKYRKKIKEINSQILFFLHIFVGKKTSESLSNFCLIQFRFLVSRRKSYQVSKFISFSDCDFVPKQKGSGKRIERNGGIVIVAQLLFLRL